MISASLPMQTEAMQELIEPRTAGQLPAPLLTVIQQSSKGPTGLGFPQLSGIPPNRVQQVLLGLIGQGVLRGKKRACALVPPES